MIRSIIDYRFAWIIYNINHTEPRKYYNGNNNDDFCGQRECYNYRKRISLVSSVTYSHKPDNMITYKMDYSSAWIIYNDNHTGSEIIIMAVINYGTRTSIVFSITYFP